MIKRFLSLIKKEDKNDWQKVEYPPTLSIKLLGFMPLRILLLIVLIFLQIIITVNISDNIHSNIGQIILTIIFFYMIYKTIVYYKRFQGMKQEGKNKNIEKALQYLIHSLKLYEEETFGVGSDKEKRIVRAIRMYYRVDDKKIFVKILKTGDKYTQISSTLATNLESSLSCKLYSFYETINYCLYTFNKQELKQFVFSKTIPLDKTFFENIPMDMIYLTNTQSFSLKKNTNMGIFGRTGTGKTVALQWYLYNVVAKGCATTDNTFLSIVDGKGADLFSLGEILKQELGENVRLGQTGNSLAKLSREFVDVMNARFEVIKNSNKLNADAYDLGMIPNFLFIDELASIKDSCGLDKKGKELWNEILRNLGLIAKKGRQASCHLIISTQDPNAENINVELRSQISSVIYLGNPPSERLKMAFSMCELKNIPTISDRKGEALFYADGNNMSEPEITIVPFVDVKTKKDFIDIIRRIKPT